MNVLRTTPFVRQLPLPIRGVREIGRFRPRLKCSVTEITSPVVIPILCPICLKTEFEIVNSNIDSLFCHRCSRGFDSNEDFVDMTLSSGVRDLEYTLTTASGTRLFENPIVSFVYERGWRQEFASSGFPGPDREFDAAMRFLSPVLKGTILDLSCGSGLFTRRFLTSGKFKNVIAVDYSAAMLTQTRQYIGRMQEKTQAELLAVRADVGRLPFPTGCFKAIFSGAAIHCWPNPAQALAEISRVLEPGGVFVFSTFTRVPKDLERLLNRPLLRPLQELARPNRTGVSYCILILTCLFFCLDQVF